MNPNSTYNKTNNNILKNSSISYKNNLSMYGKNTSSFFKKNKDNINEDNNSVDYNYYFYNTIDYFPQGNNTSSEKDFNSNINKAGSTAICFNSTKNKNKKLSRNMSQDCIYLFGQNKIIYKNEKSKNSKDILGQKYELSKTPFIDYNNEFNPYKTKSKLKKNFIFFKNKGNRYENYSEIKQEYIFKIRRMFENKKNVNYKYEYLPSQKSVKTIIRKNKIFGLFD